MKLFLGILILVSLSALCIIGYLRDVAFEAAHPCLEQAVKHDTCGGGLECTSMDSDGSCFIWDTAAEYPCSHTECVRRKP